MKNKEKYAERVLTFACDDGSFGVYEKTGEMERCTDMRCTECLFHGKKGTCHTSRRKSKQQSHVNRWLKKAPSHQGTGINYITRDMDGSLYVYISKPHKLIDCWESSACETDKSLRHFELDFPMVRWEDDEPWLIEDLRKLEVVEEYE